MAEEKKIARLVDVGGLEADLKKDLAEEEAKGKAADILFCESIEDELSDLEKLPTIDPKTLRPVGHWEVGGVNPSDDVVGNWKCDLCHETSPEDFPFCPNCGAKMEGVPYDID